MRLPTAIPAGVSGNVSLLAGTRPIKAGAHQLSEQEFERWSQTLGTEPLPAAAAGRKSAKSCSLDHSIFFSEQQNSRSLFPKEGLSDVRLRCGRDSRLLKAAGSNAGFEGRQNRRGPRRINHFHSFLPLHRLCCLRNCSLENRTNDRPPDCHCSTRSHLQCVFLLPFISANLSSRRKLPVVPD